MEPPKKGIAGGWTCLGWKAFAREVIAGEHRNENWETRYLRRLSFSNTLL